MKVNLKNIEIANIVAYSRLETSVVQDATYKFSITFAWSLKKNLGKLYKLYEDYVQMYNEIIEFYNDNEHSVTDECGQRHIKEEYLQEYNNKISELYSADNEVDISMVKLSKIVPGGLNGLDNSAMSVMDFDILSFMIDESEEESVTENE